MVKLLAVANAKIAIPDRTLFFITSSPLLILRTLMYEEYLATYEATAVPKRPGHVTYKPSIFIALRRW
jgi:hypothetical protein